MADGWDDSSSNSSSDDSSNNTRWKNSAAAKGTRAAGKSLSAAGQQMIEDSRDEAARSVGPVQYHRGGRVRKTGPAILKKNERVIPASKRKKVERMMKRKKMRMTNRGR